MSKAERRVRQTADQIGSRGELLAALALSRPVLGRYRRPLFEPTHLGAKYPAADFLVDALAASGESVGFFFVQVKATTRTGGQRRLSLAADRATLERLSRLPIPTHVVGVNLATERAYVAAAFGTRLLRRPSMSTRFPLADDAVRIALYREVSAYWTAPGRRPTKTRFADD